MTQNACNKTNTLPKTNNSAAYAMICIHCLEWGIALKISYEIAKKNSTHRNSERKPTTISTTNEIRKGITIQ